MNNQKELLVNTIIIFVGRFCTQFISFLLLPIYTSYLITSDYGVIDLIQTYISLFIPIIALRLDSSVFRFLIDERKNENNKIDIITNSLVSLILQTVIFSVLYLIIGIFIKFEYYWLIIFNILFMTLSSVLLQVSRGMGDNIGYSLTCCVTGFLTIILNIVLVIILKLGGQGVLISSGIANLVGCITLFFRNKLYKYIKFESVSKTRIKELLKYSLPMIPDGLSWWIINVSDRTFISIFVNTAANGIYAVSSKFSNILSSFFSVINMSWQESASLHINDENRDSFFSKTINNILSIFVTLCVVIMVCIPLAFDLLIGKSYYDALTYIPILLLSNIFNVLGGMFGGIYISKKLTKSVARTTIVAALVNLILNLILIKWIGLFAAALSTVVAYFVVFIYRFLDSKKYVKIKFDKNVVFKSILIFVFSTILYYINNFFTNIINFIVVAIFAFVVNRVNIKYVFGLVKNKVFSGKNNRGN